MHADNVGVKVGDEISVSGQRFKVVGLIAYVNYATLHEKSTDMMFDAIKFDVAMVTQEGFDSLHKLFIMLTHGIMWILLQMKWSRKQIR